MLCGFRRRVPPRGRPSSVSTCQAANMSALGHNRTLGQALEMSALPRKADMRLAVQKCPLSASSGHSQGERELTCHAVRRRSPKTETEPLPAISNWPIVSPSKAPDIASQISRVALTAPGTLTPTIRAAISTVSPQMSNW